MALSLYTFIFGSSRIILILFFAGRDSFWLLHRIFVLEWLLFCSNSGNLQIGICLHLKNIYPCRSFENHYSLYQRSALCYLLEVGHFTILKFFGSIQEFSLVFFWRLAQKMINKGSKFPNNQRAKFHWLGAEQK